jgi:two-component system response regulator (stage 0 sporulation protein A)
MISVEVTNLIQTLGIPANIKGYAFMRTAVSYVMLDETYLSGITKRLYPDIAKVYKTTPSKVERALRHAIYVAWLDKGYRRLNSRLGVEIFQPGRIPCNSEMIATLADRAILERQQNNIPVREFMRIDDRR